MKFELPELPYDIVALEPHISGQTLELHYGKHHQGYMDKLEKAIAGTRSAEQSLDEIVCESVGSVFNNAAQVWNHTFYWNSMAPDGGGKPAGRLADLIERDIGGFDKFKQEFAEIASGEFGSGWAWLVADDDGMLKILSTTDAGNPLCDGYRPLLTLDVWEHAYYLDYQNERGAYIEAFLDRLVNWRFAEENLEQDKTPEHIAATG